MVKLYGRVLVHRCLSRIRTHAAHGQRSTILHTYIYMYICIYVYMCVCIYVYMCVCVCVCALQLFQPYKNGLLLISATPSPLDPTHARDILTRCYRHNTPPTHGALRGLSTSPSRVDSRVSKPLGKSVSRLTVETGVSVSAEDCTVHPVAFQPACQEVRAYSYRMEIRVQFIA